MKTIALACLVVMLSISTSCKKITKSKFTGKWVIIEYANLSPGAQETFQPGLPYFFLERYAQGMEIMEDKTFYYRFADNNGVVTTDFQRDQGKWTLRSDKIIFNIPNLSGGEDELIVDIVSWKDDVLWIKYSRGDRMQHYKLMKD